MKTALRSVIAIFSLFLTVSANAQSSCVNINNNSFSINNGSGGCLKTISFTYENPTNGARRINVVVTVSGVQVINVCHDASGNKGVTLTYTSPEFTACNNGDILVSATPYNGSICSGTSCGTVYMSSFGSAPLPVTFTSFTATRSGAAVTLNWATSTEVNNTGFAIERNNNGSWEQVGFTASAALNGNSAGNISYHYTDQNNNRSMTQYRLRQVDLDGRSKYSEVRAVCGTEQDARTTVFPNPSVDGKLNVVFSNLALRDIAIADMSGRTVKQWTAYNGSSLQVTGLSTGMFTLVVLNRESGERSNEKIMITGK